MASRYKEYSCGGSLAGRYVGGIIIIRYYEIIPKVRYQGYSPQRPEIARYRVVIYRPKKEETQSAKRSPLTTKNRSSKH